MTNREDQRGHWPAGRRRNIQDPPKGWPTVERFLLDVAQHCAAEYGRQAALAEYLGVHRKTVQTWLAGVKWPHRERLLAIASWYRADVRRPKSVTRR